MTDELYEKVKQNVGYKALKIYIDVMKKTDKKDREDFGQA